MAQTKDGAIKAAIDVLKAIDGATSNYSTNFEGRVFERLFTPAERPDVKLPYACVPLDQEEERVEYEGFLSTSSFRLVCHAFFSDNPESDPLNSEGARSAARFRDDVIRAFMADQTMGGTVENCEAVAFNTSSSVIDDGIAEVVFTLEFTLMAGAADLEAE